MPLSDAQWASIQSQIFQAEKSGGNYQSYNPNSGAGGAYQFIPSTWAEKAKLYGFGEWADIPNATFAPPYIQDSVARGWASDLFDKYGGNPRYVLDAWFSGESQADYDYEKGSINSLSDGGTNTQAYVNSATPILDTSVVTTNNPDQNVTNTERLRGETISGANLLGYYMMKNYNEPLMITGGAEIGYHAKSSRGYGHEDGWKLDVASDAIAGGTQAGKEFKAFCNSNGWSANWENDHWDIDFSGQDERDPQAGGKLVFGDIGAMTAQHIDDFFDQRYAPSIDPPQVPINSPVYASMPWYTKAVDGFLAGEVSNPLVDWARSLFSKYAISGDNPQPLTEEQKKIVKEELHGDKDAQAFVLMNATDEKSFQWLLEQKLEDRRREERIRQYNEDSIISVANIAKVGGWLADPTNLIPIGGAINKLRLFGRLGKAVINGSKAEKIANKASRMGVIAGKMNPTVKAGIGASVASVPFTGLNSYFRVSSGKEAYGIDQYAFDALVAGVAGTVIHKAFGGINTAVTSKSKVTQETATKLDNIETKAMERAVDLDKVRSETIKDALFDSDRSWALQHGTKYLRGLESNGRVAVLSLEDAKSLVKEKAGIELPKTTKAFYVPNEDYAILIKDNVKTNEVDKILRHEFAVHAGLKNLMGKEAWDKLATSIKKDAEKHPDGVWGRAMRDAGSYDPEEILAHAVEKGQLKDNFVSRVKGVINKALTKNNAGVKFTDKQVREIMEQQVKATREAKGGVYFNEDGSTAFAGIQFSKDSGLNPQRWADVIALEGDVRDMSQRDLPKLLRRVGQFFEDSALFGNPFGTMTNSVSNTMRKVVPKLLSDPRMRPTKGMGSSGTILPANMIKEKLQNDLRSFYKKYASTRQEYMIEHKELPTRASHDAFDKQVFEYYNATIGHNKINVELDVDPHVKEAVKHIHDLRERQLELAKTSSSDVGSEFGNLADADWNPVDLELWRVVDIDKRNKFLWSFLGDDGKEAMEFLKSYIAKAVKKDVAKAKLQRAKEMENARIKKYNESIKDKTKTKPKEEISTEVSDEELQKWIDKKVNSTAEQWVFGNFDITSPHEPKEKPPIGKFNPFEVRLPLDTSFVMMHPNGTQFSFDNNLRDFDLDKIVNRNINRFAGEASIKAVFGSTSRLEKTREKLSHELGVAVEAGRINRSRADKELALFDETLDSIRGFKTRQDTMGRLGAVARIMQKMSYVYNGLNMGWSQIGDMAGVIGYGGVKQITSIFPPLHRMLEDARLGKTTAQTLREAEDYMFGSNLEEQIFTKTWQDTAIRDALTEDNLINKSLKKAGDVSTALSSITSAINFLPKMTDGMLRAMRVQTINDAVKWTYGEKVGSWVRKPFSPKKLKAMGIYEDVHPQRIKELKSDIKTYINPSDGKALIREWQREAPETYALFYGLVDQQARRAILSGTDIANTNNLKNMNSFTRLAFQFKDFALRAINAQSFRALSSAEIDDALTALLSVVTNTGSYLARAGFMYGALVATGQDERAKKYYDRMFNEDNITRAIAFRSTIIGSPFSYFNDLGEALGIDGFDQGTIRSSVTRKGGMNSDEPSEKLSGVISQMPALQTVDTLYNGIVGTALAGVKGETTKRDIKELLDVVPFTKWIPISVLLQKWTDSLNLKEK